MSYQRLGLLGVGLALAFWLISLIIRHALFDQPPNWTAAFLELGLLLAGALGFWWWIARRLQSIDDRLRNHAHRLHTLHQAGLSITTQTDLAAVLQTVVDQSRQLIGARYGALGVLSPDGNSIESFVVSGLDEDTYARLCPHPPKGEGLLGLPIRTQQSIRADDIAAHPASTGFPQHHPPMHTFLGVPIGSKGKIYGHLYLTDKQSGISPPPMENDRTRAHNTRAHARLSLPFDADDQSLLEMFATQAAIAIENATLYRQSQEVAVLHERERFGMDLHDGVIQSIYAAGLLLDDGIHHLPQNPALAGDRMREATTRLNSVITDIRHYIHDLRSQAGHVELGNPLAELEQLVHSLRVENHLQVRSSIDVPTLRRLTPRQSAELLQIVREALTNTRRHAHASEVTLRLESQAQQLLLEISDNGRGFTDSSPPTHKGQGLKNMRTRAEALGGEIHIDSAPSQGCTLRLTLPLPAA